MRLSHNEISFTGSNGISLNGGDRKTLTGPGHIAEDNHIHHMEAVGRMLRENETGWNPWMTHFWLRIDCHEPMGQVFIDDIRITEAAPLDEWTSWQAEGWDQHSLIADPLFVDWKNDDFRLKPESPAFKLGFKAIPVEEIGVRKQSCWLF